MPGAPERRVWAEPSGAPHGGRAFPSCIPTRRSNAPASGADDLASRPGIAADIAPEQAGRYLLSVVPADGDDERLRQPARRVPTT